MQAPSPIRIGDPNDLGSAVAARPPRSRGGELVDFLGRFTIEAMRG